MIKYLFSFLLMLGFCSMASDKPNIIYILADDLGIGDLGTYGQKIIKTPHLDQMAAEGMKFHQHYSGSTVCAPSRSVLLTGKTSGHAQIRANSPNGKYEFGQTPLAAGTQSIPTMLKDAGYATGVFGKWGLGYTHNSGNPALQGVDEFYGFKCQKHAHHYYPEFLLKNDEKVMLNKKVYAHDIIHREAEAFVRKNAENKQAFFLYLAEIIPHADLDVPADSMAEYDGKIKETKTFKGNRFYYPQDKPRTAFAAMVTRMDKDIGVLMNLLKELGIDDNTIVMFSSDNGCHIEGGADPEFFGSNGIFTGHKRDFYEGGIRTPFIVRWPSKIKAGSESNHISAFWDIMPTFAEIAGAKAPADVNGISMTPTLFAKGSQPAHRSLYWEIDLHESKRALRMGDWKLIKLFINNPEKKQTLLFNLKKDPAEQNNLAPQYPEIVQKLEKEMDTSRTPSKESPLFSKK
jgi:arylsulfatase A